MILWDAIDPAELTGYVRTALAEREQNRFTLSRFLPSRQVNDLLYRFNRGGQGLAEAATFRTYDAESPQGSRPSVVLVTGELPPISRKIRLSEYDSLRLRNADGEIESQVFNDAERLAMGIAARMELARGEALRTGKVILNENGVKATVDFGRRSAHTIASGADDWATHASADIIGDVTTWVETYVGNTGVRPDVILISRKVMGHILQNEALRELNGSMLGTPVRVTLDAANSALAGYDLPPFEVYDTQVSVNGSATKVLHEDWITMVGGTQDDGDLGATLYGTTAESLEAGYNLAGSEPGVVAGAYKTADPVAVWTKAAAIALPVLANPDLTFGVKVL